MANEFTIGSSHEQSECHLDPYICELALRMDSRLLQNGQETGFIHPDEEATLEVTVCMQGALVHHLCGEICVCAHIECLGPGDDRRLACDTQRIEGADGERCCDEDECCLLFEITIPPGTLNPQECGSVCCFVATATSIDRCGNPGHIACYVHGPCVMIHTPPEHTPAEPEAEA